MTRENNRGHLLNRYGLIVSSFYLAWTVTAKFMVDQRFDSEIKAQNIRHDNFFSTPTPFNSLLWRAVIMDEDGYYEAYYSLMDGDSEIRFTHYPSDESLLFGIEDSWPCNACSGFRAAYTRSPYVSRISLSAIFAWVSSHTMRSTSR